MKNFLYLLLLANVAAAAWLVLEPPIDVVREPGRSEQQLAPGSFHLLSDAEVAQRRSDAERKAAAIASAAVASAVPPAAAPPVELPLASCVDISGFASEGATKKLRARLAAAGLGDKVNATDKPPRLRLTGLDSAGEAQLHAILKDFPHQEMNHCTEAATNR